MRIARVIANEVRQADGAARARYVIDLSLLARARRQCGLHGARRLIPAAARRRGCHNVERLARIIRRSAARLARALLPGSRAPPHALGSNGSSIQLSDRSRRVLFMIPALLRLAV
jgi:hypothetical protein